MHITSVIILPLRGKLKCLLNIRAADVTERLNKFALKAAYCCREIKSCSRVVEEYDFSKSTAGITFLKGKNSYCSVLFTIPSDTRV